MILIFHIIIAILSVLFASGAFFRPSQWLLRITYVSIIATFGTGTYLIVASPSHLVQACVSGITYLVIVSFVTAKARAKFARTQAATV